MALSLEGIFNSYIDIEKAKISARLGATGGQQAAALGTVPVVANPQAKAGQATMAGVDRRVVIGGTVGAVALLGLLYWVMKK